MGWNETKIINYNYVSAERRYHQKYPEPLKSQNKCSNWCKILKFLSNQKLHILDVSFKYMRLEKISKNGSSVSGSSSFSCHF